MDVAELRKVQILHHAYLVVGNAEKGREAVSALLKDRGVEISGNPDLFSLAPSEFLVGMSRDVNAFAALKPLGERKYIVISWSRATGEAQNALLKSLEEAPGSSTFFISVDSIGHVLPTIRSRAIVVSVGSHEPEDTEEAEAFVKAGYEKRLATVEAMVGQISKTQDRSSARAFVRSLMVFLHGKDVPSAILRDLLDADRYIRMQGSSAKSVLGHLAAVLPRSKT